MAGGALRWTSQAARLQTSVGNAMQVGVDIESNAGDFVLRATGSTVAFPGFLAVWGGGDSSEVEAATAEGADSSRNGSDDGSGSTGSTAAIATVISSLKARNRVHNCQGAVAQNPGDAALYAVSAYSKARSDASLLIVSVLPATARRGAGGDRGDGPGARHSAAAAVYRGLPGQGTYHIPLSAAVMLMASLNVCTLSTWCTLSVWHHARMHAHQSHIANKLAGNLSAQLLTAVFIPFAQALEERGVGRPSTYAPTLQLLQVCLHQSHSTRLPIAAHP